MKKFVSVICVILCVFLCACGTGSVEYVPGDPNESETTVTATGPREANDPEEYSIAPGEIFLPGDLSPAPLVELVGGEGSGDGKAYTVHPGRYRIRLLEGEKAVLTVYEGYFKGSDGTKVPGRPIDAVTLVKGKETLLKIPYGAMFTFGSEYAIAMFFVGEIEETTAETTTAAPAEESATAPPPSTVPVTETETATQTETTVPPTEAPETAAPTSEAPATEAPTTAPVQTTAAPAPTTAAPTTAAPTAPPTTAQPETTQAPTEPPAQSVTYVLNTNSMKFHYPGCEAVDKMSPKNKQETNESRDAIIARGYDPCGMCNP